MSSILDALNKVEEEQQQLKAQSSDNPDDINLHEAVQDFVEHDVLRDKMTLRVSPMLLLSGGFSVLIVLVCVVSLVVVSMIRPEAAIPTTTDLAASTPALKDPSPSIVAPSPEATPAPPPAPAENAQPIEEIPPVAAKTPELPSPTPVVEKIPEPTPAIAIPAPPIKTAALPEPSPTPPPVPALEKKPDPLPKPSSEVLESDEALDFSASPSAAATPSDPSVQESRPKPEASIRSYPPFTPGVQMSAGLDTFKVNMVSPKSDRSPYGSAIINRKKVFEGGFIAGSQVMLYKVEKDGFALEIPRTGKRYFHTF